MFTEYVVVYKRGNLVVCENDRFFSESILTFTEVDKSRHSNFKTDRIINESDNFSYSYRSQFHFTQRPQFIRVNRMVGANSETIGYKLGSFLIRVTMKNKTFVDHTAHIGILRTLLASDL